MEQGEKQNRSKRKTKAIQAIISNETHVQNLGHTGQYFCDPISIRMQGPFSSSQPTAHKYGGAGA